MIPHEAKKGLVARVAIQCDCPDTGKTGSFLFYGESHRNKHSRVTPVYSDLHEMFHAIKPDWEEVTPGNCAYGFIKR